MDSSVLQVTDSDPVAIAARVRQLEAQIAAMPADAVDALSADIGTVNSWLTGVLAKVTARARRLQQQGQKADPKKAAAKAGLGDREAAKAAQRGDAMQKMPHALGALEDGEIGVGHADVLARHADRLSGRERTAFEDRSEQLVAEAIAEDLTPDQFEKRCRQAVDRIVGDDGIGELERQRRNSRAKAFTDPETGMRGIHGQWDPLRGEAVHKALDAEIVARKAAGARAVTKGQQARLAADALHGLICGQRLSKPDAGGVLVLVDHDTLTDRTQQHPEGARRIAERVAETSGGSPLPAETIRRIACDTGIIPLVLGGEGEPLDVGRERRLATRAQRMALRARYPTCALDDDCTVPFDHCQIHHLDPWHHGGRTDLNRMCPACTHHHHMVHEGGWTLTRNHDGTWHMHPPQRPPP